MVTEHSEIKGVHLWIEVHENIQLVDRVNPKHKKTLRKRACYPFVLYKPEGQGNIPYWIVEAGSTSDSAFGIGVAAWKMHFDEEQIDVYKDGKQIDLHELLEAFE